MFDVELQLVHAHVQVLPEAYLRLIDICITQLKAQGPSRTCNESKEEELELVDAHVQVLPQGGG